MYRPGNFDDFIKCIGVIQRIPFANLWKLIHSVRIISV